MMCVRVARQLAAEIAALQQKASTIDTFRDIVNYNYWLARVETEPTDDCLLARRHTVPSRRKRTKAICRGQKNYTSNPFEVWRKVLDKSTVLRDSQIMADELNDDIDKYKKLLGQMGQASRAVHFARHGRSTRRQTPQR